MNPAQPLTAEQSAARQKTLEEAAAICTKLAYAEYYPSGKCYQTFIPKDRQERGDLLAKAAAEIRSIFTLPLDNAPRKDALAREAKLRQQLNDATTSLETISQLAGRDENMKYMSQVCGYANSRAMVARNFLIASVEGAPHE